MVVGRLIATLILLVLNIAAAIFLQTKLIDYYTLEAVFIILLIIIGVILLVGIGVKAGWIWPVTTLYFSASLANLLFLFLSTNAIITFILAVFVNLVGMMIAVLSITKSVESEGATPVETYNVETPKEVRVETRISKKGSRRRKR